MNVDCPPEVLNLVERFERELDSYRSGKYNETQVRREFIDPMFKALGWDIDNEQGGPQAYKDVIHEDAIKVGTTTKAPDYCFRVGGARKFFLEAKKPAINVREDVAPAFQLRRYGWSAKLPLSVLTDFEEFAVYDCRVKPQKEDKASAARILCLNFFDYPTRWEEVAGIFSRDAVLLGSLDRFADSSKRKKGTAEVDDAFLAEIEVWRDSLARNLAQRNPGLTQRELNFAVQVTIDRIIFLRICEDRGIESYGELQTLCNGPNTYARLLELYRKADQRYNSGLFHFERERGRGEAPDMLTPSLTVDDKALKEILKRLYYPDSPYEFSVLPADILGQVYEQFLGKVIRLTTGHQAVVEDKPEVKKAGGVYYTPTYIVGYIVKNTVGKLLEGSTPRMASNLRILDPACGSGSFLIGAFQYLIDWHRDWYVEDGPQKHTKQVFLGPGGEWRLTTAEKKRILLNNLCGVDIDSQAVETTKLSLLLKVLEGETQETISAQLSFLHERALPDLASNIKCGNSLIGPDFYDDQQLGLLLDEDERYRINTFDWQSEFPQILGRAVSESRRGFDAVIGNPPYIQLSMAAYFNEGVNRYLVSAFSSSMGRLNTFGLFIEKVLTGLLSRGGLFSLIVPNTLLTQEYYAALRRRMLELRIVSLTSFVQPVFANAVVETVVFVIENGKPNNGNVCIVEFDNRTLTESTHMLAQRHYAATHANAFMVRTTEFGLELKAKIDQGAHRLGTFVGINQAIALKEDRAASLVSEPLNTQCKPVLDGRHIGRYSLNWGGDYLVYDLSRIHSCKRTDIFEAPQKLFFRRVGDRLTATLDGRQFYALNTLVVITPIGQDCPPLKVILGLFNSHLLDYYYKTYLKSTKHVFSEIQARQVAQLPIRLAEDGEDVRLVHFVDRMLALNIDLQMCRTPHERSSIERELQSTDRRIDKLVYELYGLADNEIAFVESTFGERVTPSAT